MEKIIKRKCKHHGITDFILENRGYYRCKKCRSKCVSKRRRIVKEKIVKLHGGKCIICGYNKYIGALQFHHLDPTIKSFPLSVRGLTRAFYLIEKEANKCVLLCANCHAEVENNVTKISG